MRFVTRNNEGIRQANNRSNEENSDLREVVDVERVFMVNGEEPGSFQAVMESSEKEEWLKEMKDEFDSLQKNETWVLVEKPEGRKVIDNKWIFKIKRKPNGSIQRYKACLVVRGFT